jgi:hypothetical protein
LASNFVLKECSESTFSSIIDLGVFETHTRGALVPNAGLVILRPGSISIQMIYAWIYASSNRPPSPDRVANHSFDSTHLNQLLITAPTTDFPGLLLKDGVL